MLGPGGVLTLTVGDAYYWPDLSQVTGPLPAGSSIYAQVDAANADTSYGGVKAPLPMWETRRKRLDKVRNLRYNPAT